MNFNRLALYAALGVPELWRIQNNAITVYVLQNGRYIRSDTSFTFPRFPSAEFSVLLDRSKLDGQRSAIRTFRELVQVRL